MGSTTEYGQELAHTRRLVIDERYSEAVTAADLLLSGGPNRRQRLETLTLRLIALMRLGRTAELTTALETAFEVSRSVSDLAPQGQLNALAALVASHLGSLDRCAVHLVRSARALNAIELTDTTTAWAWHDLAMAYSSTGFHGHALGAIDKARQVASSVGLPMDNFAAPQIRLRLAVSLDQHGDADGCQRVLRDIVGDLAQRRAAGELDDVRPSSRGAYGYALARLAAFGDPLAPRPDIPRPRPQLVESTGSVPCHSAPPSGSLTTLDSDAVRLLELAGDSPRAQDFRGLGSACLAIARRRPVEAVARLETARVADDTLGPAEPFRLRALAHLAADDHASAYRADRHAFRLASGQYQRLRELFIEAVAARIDSDELRRSVAGYTNGQHTDPLTGLPDQDHLEQHLAEALRGDEPALLFLCAVEDLAEVNRVHGRSTGDLVLQRVAGILNRVMRRGDFVARVGDDFCVVLPPAARPEIREIGRRIASAVDAEDWESLVPGTRIGVALGWAGLSDDPPLASPAQALRVAAEAVARRRRR